MLTGSVKAKDATSFPRLALQPTLSSLISALDLQEDALLWAEEAVSANLTSDLMAASSFTPTSTMIAIILALPAMLDSPVSNLSAELPTASASKVLCLQVAVLPRPPSASSTLALALAPAPSLLLLLVPRL